MDKSSVIIQTVHHFPEVYTQNFGNIEERKMIYEGLSKQIIGCAIEVHKALGPGLLESAYEECLAYELIQAGLDVQRQVAVPVTDKDIQLDCGYRLDILVNRNVVLELKSVEFLNAIHEAQILTYLKFSNHRLGLLFNFNVTRLKDGIKRYVL